MAAFKQHKQETFFILDSGLDARDRNARYLESGCTRRAAPAGAISRIHLILLGAHT